MSKNLVAIDLFCGVGGLSYGLKEAGFKVAAGVDSDKTCEYAYKTNIKADFIDTDIRLVTSESLKKYWKKEGTMKVLVGCAPCQPFSSHSNKNREREKSEKWGLLGHFLRLIRETDPTIISMENVTNLSNQQIFCEFVDELKSLGYNVSYSNVFCPDYGIPQKRRRLVLLGSKLGPINLIEKTHSPENYVTIRDTIGGLPAVLSGELCSSDTLHRTTKLSPINEKRIRASRPNGTWLDWDENLRLSCHKKNSGSSYKSVYGRMSWDEPSPTITTQFYNYGTGRFGHPDQDRALTLREAALLQTFPKNYVFTKPEDEIHITKTGIHIGNAVPVKLGYIVGLSIKKHLKDVTKKQ